MGFQRRIRRQIARFSFLLAAVFFAVSVGLLFLYSIYFNSYRARNYNRILSGDFCRVYEQYESYVASRGEGWRNFLKCLDGEMSATALALSYRSFSRDCMVTSNLILTDAGGQTVSTTYDTLTYSQERFNAQVVENMNAKGIFPYNTVYYYDSAPRYVFAQPVYDEEGTYRGCACLYLDMDGLTDNMKTLQYSGIIVHGDSRVIVAADPGMVKSFNHFYGVENGSFHLNGQEYWMYSSQLPEYDVIVYTYVGVIPFWGYYLICIMCSVGVFFLAMLLTLRVTGTIARHSAASVEQLQAEIDAVAETGEGSLSIQTGDEFEDIAQHINTMLDGIRELTDRNMELLKLNTDMEKRTLEAKFNPHFLYNTLDSIRFAVQLGMEGANTALLNLTKLLRYSVDRSGGEVTLEEDLAHIMSYLDIIRFRFGDRFDYHIQIEPECMACRVPKLLFQPAIENSVKYGFQNRQSLKVWVRGWLESGGALRLEVRDNGVGMEPEALRALQKRLCHPGEKAEQGGFSGLQSTARLLQLQYKGESRLEIDSHYGVGTTVVMYVAGRGEGCELSGAGGGG